MELDKQNPAPSYVQTTQSYPNVQTTQPYPNLQPTQPYPNVQPAQPYPNVQTTQPYPGTQPAPNVIHVQSAPPRHDGLAVGALVFALITLICCPESFICTIPSCICAIVALNDTSNSSRTLANLSLIGTGLFYIALVIVVIIFIIWWVTAAKYAIDTIDSFDYGFINDPYDNIFSSDTQHFG